MRFGKWLLRGGAVIVVGLLIADVLDGSFGGTFPPSLLLWGNLLGAALVGIGMWLDHRIP